MKKPADYFPKRLEAIRMESKYEVLVVDDDPALLKMASEMLCDFYSVSCVKSGARALALLQAGYMPDIILLDVLMPEMDGFETLASLRLLEDMDDVPVIYLTVVTHPESEIKGLYAGAADYITKPFIKEVLLARIAVHLENGKRLRQLSMMEKNKQKDSIGEAEFRAFCEELNETEQKVARLIVLGYTNREISGMLSYTYNYIKKVVAVIFEKKGVKERAAIRDQFRR